MQCAWRSLRSTKSFKLLPADQPNHVFTYRTSHATFHRYSIHVDWDVQPTFGLFGIDPINPHTNHETMGHCSVKAPCRAIARGDGLWLNLRKNPISWMTKSCSLNWKSRQSIHILDISGQSKLWRRHFANLSATVPWPSSEGRSLGCSKAGLIVSTMIVFTRIMEYIYVYYMIMLCSHIGLISRATPASKPKCKQNLDPGNQRHIKRHGHREYGLSEKQGTKLHPIVSHHVPMNMPILGMYYPRFSGTRHHLSKMVAVIGALPSTLGTQQPIFGNRSFACSSTSQISLPGRRLLPTSATKHDQNYQQEDFT